MGSGGRHQEAIEASEKLLEIRPDYENGHNNMGLAYKGLKKWDRAIQSFHEELRHHPDNIYAHRYLGESYEAIKNHPKALAHYKKALSNPFLLDSEKIRKVVQTLEAAQARRRGKKIDRED